MMFANCDACADADAEDAQDGDHTEVDGNVGDITAGPTSSNPRCSLELTNGACLFYPPRTWGTHSKTIRQTRMRSASFGD